MPTSGWDTWFSPLRNWEKEGKIEHHTYRDMANFEWYDIYAIKGV